MSDNDKQILFAMYCIALGTLFLIFGYDLHRLSMGAILWIGGCIKVWQIQKVGKGE